MAGVNPFSGANDIIIRNISQMEEEQHFSTTSMSSESHDYDEPVCPKSPKRRPFSIHMNEMPAQEKLDLLSGNSTGNLVLRPGYGEK